MTDDQKAMLRLLAQREEGYEDIAALLGIGVEEVRERVAEALAEVDSDEPARAEPPAPAPEPPAPESPEPTPAPAPEPAPAPPKAAPAPPADEPPSPATETTAPSPEPQPTAAGAPRPSRIPRLKLPKDRGALIGLGAGVLAVLALVVVLLVSGDGGSGTSEASNGAAAAGDSNLTEAILSPTDGSEASGRALFGRYKKNVLLQVEAEGLQTSPPGQSYTIWLYRSPKLVLRMGSVNVRPKDDGKIAVQLPIPTQVLGYVASGAFNQIDISLTSNAAYKAELTRAKKANRLPKYTGESVLRGKITGPAIG